MVYPSDVELRLGFDQLRLRLRKYCLSGLGERQVDTLLFLTDYKVICKLLAESLEFKQLLETGVAFPTDNVYDPQAWLATASVEGAFIEAEDLLKIALSLQTILAARSFLVKSKQPYPNLFELSEPVNLPPQVWQNIVAKIDDQGNVKDNASPELARIRKALREEQNKVRRLTEKIFREAAGNGWLPEGASPTIRDGRIVIPVLAEHKRKLRGFIMDESSTGQTVYMEPAEVLETNNDIRDLEHASRREIVKILQELSSMLRRNMDELEKAYYFLSRIDVTRAKAKLAIDMGATLPHVVQGPDLNWLHARHPLLHLSFGSKRSVIPLTIDLTSSERMLLISGPNAGGKSVCLKTVGLIQYLAQCGLLVPLLEKSTIGIFSNIFLDIGDQQSIENDLSTYSSHLKNLNYFIRHATADTLVLMDELGAGTDPNFGGGIAEAILDTLVQRKVWGVITTHYYNLKLYAGKQEGIRNGAMLFDTRKLEPLFQLEIGKPGSSFALEIARKTGLPKETLESAENIIGKELTGLETLMKTVSEDKQLVQRKETELRQKEQDLGNARSRYEKLSTDLEARKKEIIEKAKNEASFLLKETNREIEKTIRHIQENKAERKETRKVRQSLQDLSSKVKPEVKVEQALVTGVIKEGDAVRIIGQEVSGKVLSVNENSAIVQFGDLRSQVKIKQLVRSDLVEVIPGFSRARSVGVDLHKRQAQFTSTLDVRGKRADEVVPLVQHFMDDAILLSQGEVKILHGTGEGVLRKIIRDQLKKIKGVASFADEAIERGGSGITVVVLK